MIQLNRRLILGMDYQLHHTDTYGCNYVHMPLPIRIVCLNTIDAGIVHSFDRIMDILHKNYKSQNC